MAAYLQHTHFRFCSWWRQSSLPPYEAGVSQWLTLTTIMLLMLVNIWIMNYYITMDARHDHHLYPSVMMVAQWKCDTMLKKALEPTCLTCQCKCPNYRITKPSDYTWLTCGPFPRYIISAYGVRNCANLTKTKSTQIVLCQYMLLRKIAEVAYIRFDQTP